MLRRVVFEAVENKIVTINQNQVLFYMGLSLEMNSYQLSLNLDGDIKTLESIESDPIDPHHVVIQEFSI